VAATLSGITKASDVKRSICAMGHKWMWNPKWEACRRKSSGGRGPAVEGVRAKLGGEYLTSDHLAGHLSPKWAAELGLKAGIPIPVGAFDAHWDALGSNIREGDAVNVWAHRRALWRWRARRSWCRACAACAGKHSSGHDWIEAGCRRRATFLRGLRAGIHDGGCAVRGFGGLQGRQTGLLRLSWDNGDRTVLVNPELAA